MNVIILGSGTGLPSLERNAPGYYLATSAGEALIDCGSGTLLQLERAGRSWNAMDVVFITHLHADHIGDLIPLIHALRLPGVGREKPLRLVGPPGFQDYFHLHVVPVTGMPTAFALGVEEARAEMAWGEVRVRATATIHSPRLASVAYRFTEGGKSVVFSGDCDMDEGFVPFCQDADLLVPDCSSLAAGKVPGHLSAAECGLLASRAGARLLLLSHLYPIPAPPEERVHECRQHFSGFVELAHDLMEWQV